MPPKKKKDAGQNNPEGQAVVKAPVQQPKKEIKQAKQQPIQSKPVQPKKDVKKVEESKPIEQKAVKPETDSQKKINLNDYENLTEAQILQRRRLRFNLVGTQLNSEQAQKLTRERMQKFGSSVPITKQDLEKRKQKFSNPSPLNTNQDLSTLEKRRQKFGNSSGIGGVQTEDQKVLEERKKKFAQSSDINLDEQIEKGRSRQKKFRGNNFRQQNHSHHKFSRFNRGGY